MVVFSKGADRLSGYMTKSDEYWYQKGRADAIEEIINILAKKEDTILSDKQYYTIKEYLNNCEDM